MPTKPADNKAAVIAFSDAAEFEVWLEAHVDLRVGLWLKIAKRGSGVPSLTDDEAVDLACATAGSPATASRAGRNIRDEIGANERRMDGAGSGGPRARAESSRVAPAGRRLSRAIWGQ